MLETPQVSNATLISSLTPFFTDLSTEQEQVSSTDQSAPTSTITDTPVTHTGAAAAEPASSTAATNEPEKPSSARMPSFLKETATSSIDPSTTDDTTQAAAAGKPLAEPPTPLSSEPATSKPTEDSAKSDLVAKNEADKPDAAPPATDKPSQDTLGSDLAARNESYKPSPFDPNRRSSRAKEEGDFSPDRGVSPGQLPSGEHVPTGVKGEKLRLGDKLKSKFHFGSKK